MKNHNVGRGFVVMTLVFSILLLRFCLLMKVLQKHRFRDISDEMYPAIPYNSTVIVNTNITKFNGLKIGDIIDFKTPSESDGSKIIIHTISDIIEQGNKIT